MAAQRLRAEKERIRLHEESNGIRCVESRRNFNLHILKLHAGAAKKSKSRSIPRKYYQSVRDKKERNAVKKNIRKSRAAYKKGRYVDRIKVKSAPKKKSKHVEKAKRMYRLASMGNLQKVSKATKCSTSSLRKILKKGRGAYYSSGSRPNQTQHSWAMARLASAITGGPAARVDCKELREGKCGKTVMKLAAAAGCKKKRKT